MGTLFGSGSVDFGIVAPGQSVTWQMESGFFPADAHVTATIVDDSSGGDFTVRTVTSYKRVLLPPDPDPGGPGELPHGGGVHNIHVKPSQPYEDKQQAQTNGSTPLAVNKGELVGIVLQFLGPAPSTDNPLTATLRIQDEVDGTTTMPLKALVRGIDIDIPPSFTIATGRTVSVPFHVKLVSGPSTTVSLSLVSGVSGISISVVPSSLAVSKGSPGLGALQISTLGASPGDYSLELNVDAFGTLLEFVNFTVKVTPLTLAPSPIDAKYATLGGPAGFLGSPTAAETFCSDLIGQFRSYAHGAIYWSGTSGSAAFEVHGPILSHFLGTNLPSTGPSLGLGYPTTDVGEAIAVLPGVGQVSQFEHGAIYWKPSTLANTVPNGPINDAWGGPAGQLGFPIADQVIVLNPAQGPAFSFQDFENGVVYLTANATSATVAALFTGNQRNFTGTQPNAFHAQTLLNAVSQIINVRVSAYNSKSPPPDNSIGMQGGPYFPNPGAPVLDYSVGQTTAHWPKVQNRRFHVAQNMFARALCDPEFTVTFDLELDLGGPVPAGTPDLKGHATTDPAQNSLIVTLSNAQCVITKAAILTTDSQRQQIHDESIAQFEGQAIQHIALPNEPVSYIAIKTLLNGDFAVFLAIPSF